MLIEAIIIKTAILKAKSEKGKYSEEYKQSGSIIQMNGDDIKKRGLKNGQNVRCTNPSNGKAIVLSIRENRYVLPNQVNIMNSLWSKQLGIAEKRKIKIELEPTNENPLNVQALIHKV